MKAVVIGGAGRMCVSAVKDFVEQDDVTDILLIDANEDVLAARKKQMGSDKIKIATADVTDISRMASLITGYDVALNAISHVFNMDVMNACLEAKVNYTDFGGLFLWAKDQLTRHDDFKKAGITGIVGSGCAPGIINVLAKYAVDRLDSVKSILMADGIINLTLKEMDFIPQYSLYTIIDEFNANNFEFIDGKMVELPPFSHGIWEEFPYPKPYDKMWVYNVLHSEVYTMPYAWESKGLKNCSFKLALHPAFEEKMRWLMHHGMGSDTPVEVKGQMVKPKDFLVSMFETKPGQQKFPEKPDDHKYLKVYVDGEQGGKEVRYLMECALHPCKKWNMPCGPYTVGYPAAVTCRMLGNGWIKEKGFFSGEQVIDPDIYFRELMKRDGIEIKAQLIKNIKYPLVFK
jgi:saccharopine dehydrogenase (NAD+, L-lysine-forming)